MVHSGGKYGFNAAEQCLEKDPESISGFDVLGTRAYGTGTGVQRVRSIAALLRRRASRVSPCLLPHLGLSRIVDLRAGCIKASANAKLLHEKPQGTSLPPGNA